MELRLWRVLVKSTAGGSIKKMRTGNAEGGTESRAEFSRYDNRTFAVQINNLADDKVWLVRGIAHLVHYDGLGMVLRISLADEIGSPTIILSEPEFSGSIMPDGEYGCDYVLRLVNESTRAA
jgi:hypothetical protein